MDVTLDWQKKEEQDPLLPPHHCQRAPSILSFELGRNHSTAALSYSIAKLEPSESVVPFWSVQGQS